MICKRAYFCRGLLQDKETEGGQVVYITDIRNGVLCGNFEDSEQETEFKKATLKVVLGVLLKLKGTNYTALAESLGITKQFLYHKLKMDTLRRKELATIREVLKLTEAEFDLILNAE
jgi:hypothetical protein